MRKRLLFLVVCLLAQVLWVSLASAQEPTELTIWTISFNDETNADWQEIIAAFEVANPDIHVNFEQRDSEAHQEIMHLAAGTDGAPDIFFHWAGLGQGGEYVGLGVSEPLNDAYEQYGWDERFVGSALTRSMYGDEHHGVPYTVHGMLLYYRKDAFEQAGITEEPTTYEELIAANDALVAAGIIPVSFGGTASWHIMRLTDTLLEMTCGAEIHDGLKSLELNWADEPCATEAFVELARWKDSGYLGDSFMSLTPQDASLLLYTGQAAMVLEGDWMVNSIASEGEDLDNYGMFLFPTGTDRLYFYAEMDYITSDSASKDAAIRFLDFLSSDEIQQTYLGTFGAISVNKNVEYGADRRPLEMEWSDVFANHTEVYEPSDQAFPPAVNNEFWRVQNSILTDAMNPNEAAGIFQEFVDNYLAENS
jgi:raffinose/stachyose/melibiose transport system substrate-binding protein